MASQRRQLVQIVGGFIKSTLPDYYYLYINPLSASDDETAIAGLIQREPDDYYKLVLGINYAKFKSDMAHVSGIQSRIFFVAFNSVAAGYFGAYPADAEFCVNRTFGYSARRDSLISIAHRLDQTSEKALKITAGRKSSGIVRFAASLSDKGAEILIEGSLLEKEIGGILKPFFGGEKATLAGIIADYITGDYALRHAP